MEELFFDPTPGYYKLTYRDNVYYFKLAEIQLQETVACYGVKITDWCGTDARKLVGNPLMVNGALYGNLGYIGVREALLPINEYEFNVEMVKTIKNDADLDIPVADINFYPDFTLRLALYMNCKGNY